MSNRRHRLLLVAGIVGLAAGLLIQTAGSTAAVAENELGPTVWFPLAWYGASPWQPTATPTATATPTRTATATRTPTVTPTPLPALSIGALNYQGTDEYIQIVNAGPGSQSLYGWKIRSVVGEQWYDFPWGIVLAADGAVYVHSGPDAVDNPPQHLKWSSGYIWNNAGDVAELYDSLGHLVDRWEY